MLHTKVPPSFVTANPKSEGESIVLPLMGLPMSPPPTICAEDARLGEVEIAKTNRPKAKKTPTNRSFTSLHLQRHE
jgi:hypothetical protein